MNPGPARVHVLGAAAQRRFQQAAHPRVQPRQRERLANQIAGILREGQTNLAVTVHLETNVAGTEFADRAQQVAEPARGGR
jgi:hypothetical protein